MKVERSVVLAAPADDVWDAIVEPGRLAAWFGGRVELEARAGGRVLLADDRGERWGTVESLEPGRHLVLRLWERSHGLTGTRVEFFLDQAEGGTRLTVVESQIESGGGWSATRLPATVGRG